MPLPYSMCSQQECEGRVRANEVSRFEADEKRQLDPCKAIQKYRRAASSGSERPPRTVSQLHTTVNYLLEFFIQSFEEPQIENFLPRVQFYEDRMRAVQVDLVKRQEQQKTLQFRIAKAQIWLLYWLSDNIEGYEHTFGQKALHTALSGYLASSTTLDSGVDDEMLSYSLLVQLNHQLLVLAASDDDESCLPLLSKSLTDQYRSSNRDRRCSPKFQWTLKLISRAALGHWQAVLAQLMLSDKNATFTLLARCCLAPSLAFLRWKTLQAFNMSLSKNQTVAELPRLLFLDDLQTIQSYLPCDDESGAVLFKVAPIQPFRSSRIREDSLICFGWLGNDGPTEPFTSTIVRSIIWDDATTGYC